MKKINTLLCALIILLLFSCTEKTPKTINPVKKEVTEVIVLGTIHDGHLKENGYGISVLTQLIKDIKPDIICAEIPPDRFAAAVQQFADSGKITEARVKRFPEYTEVIFSLTKTMDFELVPTAGWTAEMAKSRQATFKNLETDSVWKTAWAEYSLNSNKSDSLMAAWGDENDPLFVNSPKYDEAVEVWAEPYNRLFNDEIGLGGWDNINKAHFKGIDATINDPKNKGKRILITYGAGHKGWFLRELKKRKDIKLIDVRDFIKKG